MPDLWHESGEEGECDARRSRSLMQRWPRSFGSRVGTLVACLGLLSGCVSEDAGYQDVRKVVMSRTGHDVRWGHLEGDSASQNAVRQLLAKPLTAENAVKVSL